jgi:serine/threonine-protein kinase
MAGEACANESSSVVPHVPGYEVLGPIGAGGMGTVWRARQLSMRRDVALKFLSSQHCDPAGRARFVREIELAGGLHHPNIGRVYDSGLNQGGYYYAMELVDGARLDTFVRDRLASETRPTLLLMRQVCTAVQYAHARGVIHRDLKPSNILVSADGQPHVLDFGLAKSLLVREDRSSDVTQYGSAPGTPAYMSPEQAAGDGERVGTWSDVYSLGKILFEMLARQPAHSLAGSAFAVQQRVVSEEVRRPRSLCKSIDSELEAVLLKALQREPEQRYATAGDLAKDIDNYLRGEALAARPITIRYLLRKKAAKHRRALAAVLMLFLALGASAWFTYGRFRAEQDKTQSLQAYLDSVLKNVDPQAPDMEASTRRLLNDASRELSNRLKGQPEAEASVRDNLGSKLLVLGRHADAVDQFVQAVSLRTKARGRKDPLTLESMAHLTDACRQSGELDAANNWGRQLYDLRRGTCADSADHGLLQAANMLALTLDNLGRWSEAESFCRPAYRISLGRWKQDDPDTTDLADCLVGILRNRAVDLRAQGKREEAEQVLAEASLVGEQNLRAMQRREPGRLSALESAHSLASVFSIQGKFADAQRLYKGLFDAAALNPALSDSHPDVIIWNNDFAFMLFNEGGDENVEQAAGIYRRICPLAASLQGLKHRYAADIPANFAAVLAYQHNWTDAERYSRLAISLWPGNQAFDRRLATVRDTLAYVLSGEGKWAESQQMYRDIYNQRRGSLPPDDLDRLKSAENLGEALAYQRNWREAEPLLAEAYRGRKSVLPGNDPELRRSEQFWTTVKHRLAGNAGTQPAAPTGRVPDVISSTSG